MMCWLKGMTGREARLTVAFSGLVLLATGCARTSYQGIEPSARTFHEDANARDFYVGMDLQFAVDQDVPHVPAAQRYDPDLR